MPVKKRCITIVAILLSLPGFSQWQPKPQLRLKTGFSILFPSPGGTGYAFKTAEGAAGSIVLGGEFSHPFKNNKGAWHAGFTFQDSYNMPAPNFKNIDPSSTINNGGGYYFEISGAPAKTTLYGGMEKYLQKNTAAPSKNYFSIIGGAGFSFTLNKFSDWQATWNRQYTTYDGITINGYTSDYIKPAFTPALSLYGGIRYNITNRKGNEVLVAELLFNYGLTPFYKQTIDYNLNGLPKQDILKEKGVCLQLNLIVPLYSFNKQKK